MPYPAARRPPFPRARPTAAGWRLPVLLAVLAVLFAGGLPGSALAQPAASARAPANGASDAVVGALVPATSGIDRAAVEARLAAAEKNSELTEEARARLVEQYRSVLTNLDRLAEHDKAALEFRQALDEAPGQAAAIRARIADAKPVTDPPVALPAGADLAEVERQVARKQAEVATLGARLATLRESLEADDDGQTGLRRRLAETRQALADAEAALADVRTGTDEAEPRGWLLESRRDLLRAEVLMLDQQLLSADARRTLAEAQRDEAEFDLARREAERAWLQAELEQRRRAEAEQVQAETEAARKAAVDAHPLVRELTRGNAALAETIQRLTGAIEEVEARRKTVEEQTARVEQDYRGARARLEAGGLNQAFGRVLLEQRDQLPDQRELRREAARRAEAIAASTLALLTYRDQLEELSAADGPLAVALAELRESLDPVAFAAVEAQAQEELARRADLLRRAQGLEERKLRALADLDFAAGSLADAVGGYRAYLAERLLWVRSNVPVTEQAWESLPGAVRWLVDPRDWLEVARVAAAQWVREPALWIGTLVLVGLLLRRPAWRRAIRASAEPLRRVSTDRFSVTLKAVGLTLLVALPLPLAFGLTGIALVAAIDGSDFTKSVGQGLVRVTLPLYFLGAFRVLCMIGGVADRHFRWSAGTLRQLRLNMDLVIYALLPIGFIASVAHANADPAHSATLGRVALFGFAFGFALVMAYALQPKRGVLKRPLAAHPDAWISRLWFLWYPLVVGVPLALAGLSLAGYQYTVGVLLNSLIGQLWLALGLVVGQQLVVRWLLVTRRSLALQSALERRAQRDARRDGANREAPGAVTDLGPIPEEAVDLAALDNQTRRLVNGLVLVGAVFGLWLIWSDVLPALNILERVTLWTYTATADGVDRAVPFTLADLGVILLIVVVSLAAARNLPGFIEIILLKNAHISAGGRYAVTTLAGYAITAVGVLSVFGALGLNWGQVQWLVAALSVGIGFGLQEIVANFISGLIILFERPVRVGDVVTVGDTTGVVTKIEIRATTIRNWDRQELLVPNKEFITGRLLNWTLSDQINRISIPVGVDYGSNPRAARELLAAIAADHPTVLKDPAPLVSFESFGDNTLNLVLRCFLGSMDGRLDVITELHEAIHARFEAAGISIAFPQRDIHLRSASPLEVLLSGGCAAAAGVKE